MKTLEEFRATRRKVDDIAEELGVNNWETAQPGLIYDYEGAAGYIEIQPDGSYFLQICRDDYSGFEEVLPLLEEHLYTWIHGEMNPVADDDERSNGPKRG